MKKIISVFCLIFGLVLAGNASAASTYTYALDIDIPNLEMLEDAQLRVGGVLFEVEGGVYGEDWNVNLGEAVPVEVGNWIIETYGSVFSLYDNYDYGSRNYAPMNSGNILTITSDVELLFSGLMIYDFAGSDVSPNYYQTAGIVGGPTVPVPGAVILIGSGLAGLIGIRRRK